MIYTNSKVTLNIYSLNIEKCTPGHSFGPGVQFDIVIHFIKSGKGTFTVDGKTYELSSGQCFYFSDRDIVYYEADKKDPWEYCYFTGSGETLEDFVKKAGFSGKNHIIKISNPNLIYYCFENILFSHDSFSKYAGIFTLLKEIINNSNKTNATDDETEDYVSVAKSYIRNNLHRQISVLEISSLLRLERSYVCRLFKNSEGMSPQKYIIKSKMNEAYHLIYNNRLTVSQAAHSVGYDDHAAFSKLFKKTLGFSPSECKNKILKPEQ